MNRQSYNRIAGQSVERLAALSDGIFAMALTLLVLDLRLPRGGSNTQRARYMAGAGGDFSTNRDVPDEFSDPGNFLGGPAKADESVAKLRSSPDLDSHGGFVRGNVDAVFDQAAG